MSREKYYQLRPSALSEAMEEWYEELSSEEREWVDRKAAELKLNIDTKANGNKVMLGEKGAREVLGALLAHCFKWELKKT